MPIESMAESIGLQIESDEVDWKIARPSSNYTNDEYLASFRESFELKLRDALREDGMRILDLYYASILS